MTKSENRYPKYLYGENARRTWLKAAQAQAPEERQELLAQAERESEAFKVALERDAFQADKLGNCGCMASWISYLPITWKQKTVLSWVLGIQSKEGSCSCSLAEFGRLVNCDRNNAAIQLRTLFGAGYLDKARNGATHPSTYTVNKAKCIKAAKANGWDPCIGYEWAVPKTA